MPVPNRPIYVKKLAGGVAYYSGPPPVPPVITTLEQMVPGSCYYPAAGTCVARTQCFVTYTGTEPLTFLWAVTGSASITAGQGTAVVSIETTGSSNTTYNVTCTITNAVGSDTKTVSFTDTRAQSLAITTINRTSGGSCQFTQNTPTCVSSSNYSVTTTGGSGTKTYNWTATNGVTVTNSTTATPTMSTPASAANLTYDVTCVVTDSTGSPSRTQSFTDTKTQEPPITITSIVRSSGGSCEYPSAGTCVSTGTYKVSINNQTGTVVYNWSVASGSATITSGNGTDTVTVSTAASATNTTFQLACVVQDTNSTAQLTQSFTDTKTPEPVYRIALINASGAASRSSDNGTTWSKLTPNGLNTGNTSASFLAVRRNGDVWISGATEGWTSRSTDNSNTWTALPRGLNTGANLEIRKFCNNGNVWVAVMQSGYASRSTDNGATWTALPQNLGVASTVQWRSIANNGTVWVAVGDSGYASRSTDNGATWTQLLPAGLNSGSTFANFNSVACNGNTWITYGENARGSKSVDNGVTWTALPQNLGTSGLGFNDMIYANGRFMGCGNGSGATGAYSTDNGATWIACPNSFNSTPTATQWRSISFYNGVWVVGSQTGPASISSDGITWTTLPQGLNSGLTGSGIYANN